MKKVLLMTLSVFLLFGCSLRYSVKKGYDFSKIHRIAVVDFSSNVGYVNSGDVVADEFVLQMVEQGFNIIERSKVNLLIRERGISSNDYQQLGKLAGVDAILTGSVSKYMEDSGRTVYTTDVNGNSRSEISMSRAVVGVSARLIDVSTGEIIWTARDEDEAFDLTNAVGFLVSGFVESLKSLNTQSR